MTAPHPYAHDCVCYDCRKRTDTQKHIEATLDARREKFSGEIVSGIIDHFSENGQAVGMEIWTQAYPPVDVKGNPMPPAYSLIFPSKIFMDIGLKLALIAQTQIVQDTANNPEPN
jgi:hypothetical protein